jgi:predicted  nucleic acid-binding Zn-ribbon protein
MAAKHIRSGGSRSPSRTVSRSVANRSVSRSTPRRSTNVQRTANRTVRRTASRQQTQSISNRPRPAVRPVQPVKRVMNQRQQRPVTPSSRPQASPARAAAPTSRPRPMPSTRPSRRPVIVRPGSRGRQGVGVSAREFKRGPRMGAAGASLLDGALVSLNTEAAPDDLSAEISALEYALSQLQQRAGFTALEQDVAALDNNLNHALNLLESARDKGYKYQGDLEEIAYNAASRWQKVRDEVQASLAAQSKNALSALNPVNNGINQLNAALNNASTAARAIAGLRSEIDKALNTVTSAERAVEAIYADIESDVYTITARLTSIHWMLTQLEGATFRLEGGEDLFNAVKARWDQQGKDDPEGALFLTNQRLIFERNEKVATKKVLFVTTASEHVQEVMVAENVKSLKVGKAHNKGLFGHQDFLDVDFENKKVNKVSYHLNGQSSKEWADDIKDAQSGELEKDRVKGAGLSFADLTGELTSADIVALQSEVNELQDEMMLKELQSELSELENETSTLTRELNALRSRGYAIEKDLEADIEVLALQWSQIKERAQKTLDHQTGLLSEHMKSIQKQMSELAGQTGDLKAARPAYIRLKSAIASAEAQADAAEETVYDQYDEYADEVEALHAHMEWVDWMLDALDTAAFKLLATESGVAAVEAVWERPGLEPENGILFLTEQRLLWEDRVGDFELKFDVPLANLNSIIEEVDEDTGAETLIGDFSGNVPVTKARFALVDPVAEAWLQMIGRAQSGGYNDDRAIELDKAMLERIRNAPTSCPNCAAAFTAPILRGQEEIICEYCGTPTRLK